MKKLIFFLAVIGSYAIKAQIPTEGLVAHFELDNNAEDSSGNENHGVIVGEFAGNENRFGAKDKALLFDGLTNYMEVLDVSKMNISDAVSISLWINPLSLSTEGFTGLVNKWQFVTGLGGRGYYLGINPEGLTVRWNTGSVNTDANMIQTDEWVNIVATYDSTTMNVYRNCELEKSIPADESILPTTVPFRIGAQSQLFEGTQFFHGAVDEVLVYDRALTQSEITQICLNEPTSIEEIGVDLHFDVYPNPFTDQISIETRIDNLIYCEILNEQGMVVKRIHEKNIHKTIEMQELPSGYYILKAHLKAGNFFSKKIIKI
ncbi:MAG: LamG-like jellyroll fold domain-containing protein [Bacteroidota bacterium]